jgi:hypothetical protein
MPQDAFGRRHKDVALLQQFLGNRDISSATSTARGIAADARMQDGIMHTDRASRPGDLLHPLRRALGLTTSAPGL